ncbi:hypothetical protein DYI26_23185, partial [Halomonas litopenaei]|nr:hypothetical protein [Halomonas litopenaei]
ALIGILRIAHLPDLMAMRARLSKALPMRCITSHDRHLRQMGKINRSRRRRAVKIQKHLRRPQRQVPGHKGLQQRRRFINGRNDGP